MKRIFLTKIFAVFIMTIIMTNTMAYPASDAKQAAASNSGKTSVSAKSKLPYYIKVSKSKCTMTVYSADDSGKYTNSVKVFKAAVGKTNALTPSGKFSIKDKEEWHEFSKGYYSKFACKFEDGLYIYSSLFQGKNTEKPVKSSVEQIGTKSTSGCIILSLADSEWVYKNCPAGTTIEIVS